MSDNFYLLNLTEKKTSEMSCFLLLYSTYINQIWFIKVEQISFQ
jgi:hypothetical protein